MWYQSFAEMSSILSFEEDDLATIDEVGGVTSVPTPANRALFERCQSDAGYLEYLERPLKSKDEYIHIKVSYSEV